MKNVGKLISFAALGAVVSLCFLATPARAEGSKIAFLDIKRCVTETKMGKKYGEEFRAKRDELTAEVKAKEAEVKAFIEDYDRQVALLSDKAKKEKEAQFEEKKKAFQKFYESAQEEMKRSSDKLTEAVLKDIEQIMRGIAEKGGYDIVMNTNGPWILYLNDSSDITEEVMKAYDEKAEGK